MKDALGHGSNAGHAAGTLATPKLQRRHFEAFAAELKRQPDAGSTAHAALASVMAQHLATTNPGFRRDLFLAAAGVKHDMDPLDAKFYMHDAEVAKRAAQQQEQRRQRKPKK